MLKDNEDGTFSIVRPEGYGKCNCFRQLTDQEIIDIAFEYDGISDLVRFARIILKKAQEK